jgi:hypothetical protein
MNNKLTGVSAVVADAMIGESDTRNIQTATWYEIEAVEDGDNAFDYYTGTYFNSWIAALSYLERYCKNNALDLASGRVVKVTEAREVIE